jgi:hypothetical protein
MTVGSLAHGSFRLAMTTVDRNALSEAKADQAGILQCLEMTCTPIGPREYAGLTDMHRAMKPPAQR